MLYQQNYNETHEESDLPSFSYGYRKCMFVDFLTRYIGPPDYVPY